MHFSDLRVYKISVDLSIEIENLIENIPRSELRIIDQIKRSANSIAPNIAEGFGKRIYPKDFIKFLSISLDSSDETQSHLIYLYKRGVILKDRYEILVRKYKDLSIRILNLIKSIKTNNLR